MAVVLNFEDFQLFAPWFVKLLSSYCSFVVEKEGGLGLDIRFAKPVISFHTRLNGLEVDVLVRCVSKDGQATSFILELKEDDLAKVLEQAVMRRGLADYVYAVVDLPVKTIIEAIGTAWVRDVAEEAFKRGVGLVSGKDGVIVVPAKKFRRVDLASRLAGLTKWLLSGGGESERG